MLNNLKFITEMNGAVLSNTYQNEVSVKSILKYFALSLEIKIISLLNNAQFFGISTDGSIKEKKRTEYDAAVIRCIILKNWCEQPYDFRAIR